jgi:uncharacterized protein (DUF58 family)
VAVGVFPLVPRRRVIGLAFGGVRSLRRGVGSDIAGSREYRLGDDIASIDWASSARLSAARDGDEFIVHERFADESPRVVMLADRRPSMGIRASALRRLDKPQAMLAAIDLIATSSHAARCLMGYLDHAEGDVHWRPPRSQRQTEPVTFDRPFRAPADAVTLGLRHLRHHRRELPTQAFVFVISDFLVPPDMYAWQRALEQRWELVPVVIQDPVWERSFPAEVGGITVPYADPKTGRVVPVYLTRAEAEARRTAHDARAVELTNSFRTLGLEPVVVGSHRPDEMLSAFLRWADLRVMARGALA